MGCFFSGSAVSEELSQRGSYERSKRLRVVGEKNREEFVCRGCDAMR